MINTLRKLNGWRRLWVMVAVVWFLLVGYYTVENYPGARPSFERIGRASCILSNFYGKDLKRAVEEVTPSLASFEEGSPETCKNLFEKIAQSGHANEVQQLHDKYLQERRLRFFARAFAYWVIPVLIAYLLGMGAAWVIRGFRRPAP